MNKHLLATLVNAILSCIGYRLCRHPRCLQKYPRRELTLTAEDAVALFGTKRASRDQRATTLVQVGAYPTDEDPLSLISDSPYRMILVEPQPSAMARLKDRYLHDPRIEIVGSAIGSKPGISPFFVVENADGILPAWLEQLASFDRSHLEKFARVAPEILPRIRQTQVNVETLPSMLARLNMDTVDILLIDTEGHDYEILRQIAIMKAKPAVVRFEHGHLTRHDREAAWEFLVNAGYRIALLDRDTLGVLDEQA
jgi:FkbM family methyltransferase